MKAEVPATGKVESGFRMPSDGWHVFKFEEGIGLLTNNDGDIIMNDRGARCWKFVLSVDDDKDEDNGTTIDVLVYEDSKKGADMVESWLAATGLLGKFAKNFPNNEVFDEPVMSKVKVSLPFRWHPSRPSTGRARGSTRTVRSGAVRGRWPPRRRGSALR